MIVRGRVVDPFGAPVENARVSVPGPPMASLRVMHWNYWRSLEARTDELGEFSLHGFVPPGPLRVEAEHADHEDPAKIEFEVGAEEVVLTLEGPRGR